MESLTLLLLSFLCISLYYLYNFLFSGYGKEKLNKLPPGPKPLPILGNLLQLTDKPHIALADLSRVHGPLMTLKLGQVSTVVVSSADIAKEVLLKHDLAFSSRQVPDAARALNHDIHSVAWLPVSPKWRSLRKVASVQLFSVKCLNQSQPLRHKKVLELLEYVGECCRSGLSVDIGRLGFTTSLNLLSSSIFSEDLAGYRAESSQQFRKVFGGVVESVGKPNLADFFPVLRWFDPHGVRRDLTVHYSRLLDLLDDMISKRLSSHPTDDVLDTLLRNSKQDDSDLNYGYQTSTNCMSFFLLDFLNTALVGDLFAAGTDTTSSAIEWAMTELLRNPSKMEKAQLELSEVLGNKKLNDIVQEKDIERLPYLQAIVKETLRLHPPAPLMLPHKARDDVQLCGYCVPKNTQVLINAWAIGRDPEKWKNPDEFLPERFLERTDIDYRGQDFELIPFGAGRRICPGLMLAHRMLHIMLATLLHSFNWELPNGMKGYEIDMNDKFSITLQKAKPLLAIPLPK